MSQSFTKAQESPFGGRADQKVSSSAIVTKNAEYSDEDESGKTRRLSGKKRKPILYEHKIVIERVQKKSKLQQLCETLDLCVKLTDQIILITDKLENQQLSERLIKEYKYTLNLYHKYRELLENSIDEMMKLSECE